jgi:hypothetical protein
LVRRLANAFLRDHPHIFTIFLFYLKLKIGFIVSLLCGSS